MDAAKKSFELQQQVRQNAEVYKNAVNDLYNWQKEIKDKEEDIQNALDNRKPGEFMEYLQKIKETPVRSQQQKSAPGDKAKALTEKIDKTFGTEEGKRKRANEYKESGNAHVKVGDYTAALNWYTTAIETYPEDPIFFCNRALCLLKLKRYEECIEDCDRAIDLDTKLVKAYYRRMLANEGLEHHKDALKDCTTVLSMDPRNSDARQALGRINEFIRKDARNLDGPNFTPLRENKIDIEFEEKESHEQSQKPLRRTKVVDIIGPKPGSEADYTLKISDEDIDKIFNSNCGEFVEVKSDSQTSLERDSKPMIDEVAAAETEESADSDELSKEAAPKLEVSKPKAAKPAAAIQEINKETKASAQNTETVNLKNTEADESSKKKFKTGIETEEKKQKEMPKIQTEKPKTEVNKSETANQTKAEAAEKPQQTPSYPLPPPPTTTAQFYTHWKELAMQQKYAYLKSIELRKLCRILGAGFDSDTLSDILRLMIDHYMPQKDTSMGPTLLEVSKNEQVKILSMFMTSVENRALLEFLKHLNLNPANAAMATAIAKNFNLI